MQLLRQGFALVVLRFRTQFGHAMQILDEQPSIGSDAMNQLDLGTLFFDRRFQLLKQIVSFANFPLQVRRSSFDARGRSVKRFRQGFALLRHLMDRSKLYFFLLYLTRLIREAQRKPGSLSFEGSDVL